MDENDLKDLEKLKSKSLRHRLAMAFIYQNPTTYLIPEEMSLYEKKVKEHNRQFEGIDKSGPYRVENIKGSWYVVGHGEVSRPCLSFDKALRMLVAFESDLKQTD